jgi:hypothetical protein
VGPAEIRTEFRPSRPRFGVEKINEVLILGKDRNTHFEDITRSKPLGIHNCDY